MDLVFDYFLLRNPVVPQSAQSGRVNYKVVQTILQYRLQ